MKRILLTVLVLFISFSVFAQIQEVESNELVKTLEKNRKTDVTFVSNISLNTLTLDKDGIIKIISGVDSEKYTLVAEVETELLKERLNYKNLLKYKVFFQLRTTKPKTYAITKIEGIETVAEYKARLESERLAKLEAERIAEEKRLEEERVAAEKARIAEEKRLEEERVAAEKARIAEEKRQRNEKFLQIYNSHLGKAKEYEKQKRWCYALGAYYDAMGTVDLDPEYKTEAVNGYNALKETILSGNPGIGTFNAFALHDEWKKLLIDAEKYGCSFNPYLVELGELKQDYLDYTTKTAKYSAKIKPYLSYRYQYTINIIKEGYKKARKNDWDLPSMWPELSVSYNNDGVYNVNGAYIFRAEEYDWYGKVTDYSYYNAFAEVDYPNNARVIKTLLVDCKFNIVDENGKELVKPKRVLLSMEDKITFEGISADIMDLIDNGKAFLNPVACYLEYGKFRREDAKGGRSFIKNFPEAQLPMETAEFICWNNKFDKTYDSIKKITEYEKIQKELATVDMEKLDNIDFEMLKIPEKNIAFAKTETTQDLYETIMGENPSFFKDRLQNPVENMSYYDVIYFCNKLSLAKGLQPVYSVKDSVYVSEWNYTPHQGNEIYGTIVTNDSANGYRLPTIEEWQYAAKGGDSYIYAGSNNVNEVAWFNGNSNKTTHPVGQKKPNGYGLYDMSGNVVEMCIDSEGTIYCGGSWCYHSDFSYYSDRGAYIGDGCKIDIKNKISYYKYYGASGFRIVRTITE